VLVSSQTVPVQIVHRFLTTAQRRGVEVRSLMLAAGIPGDIAGNPRARVTVEQLTRLMQQLWQVTDDELFGLGPGPMPRGTVRMVALGVIHAADLRTALTRLCEFTALVPGCPRFTAEMTDATTRLSFDASELDDPVHLVTDLLMAAAHRLPGWMIGTRIPLRSVELPYPRPAEIDDYPAVFGRMPTFGADAAAITFDSTLLDSPIIRNEAELLEYVRRSPSDLFAVRDYGSTMADRVRKILEQGLRGTWPGADEVAARLAISAQHLRRLLREEGTSVSLLKEDLLRDAAIESLARGEESIDDLAARLGFSEASAFRRAFRRWTGSPPGAYRMAGEEPATANGR